MDNNTIEIQSQVPGGLWAGTIIPQEMATLPMLITLVSIKGFSGMLITGWVVIKKCSFVGIYMDTE